MKLIVNKKAMAEYAVEETYTAGVALTGGEVKSLRNQSGSLSGSYVKILSGEVFLIGAQITPYKFANNQDYDPKRTRKLLLRKNEIEQLMVAVEQKKRALVPLYFETVGRTIKLTFGVGRGLKQYEKRERIKKRDQERDMRRELKWGK